MEIDATHLVFENQPLKPSSSIAGYTITTNNMEISALNESINFLEPAIISIAKGKPVCFDMLMIRTLITLVAIITPNNLINKRILALEDMTSVSIGGKKTFYYLLMGMTRPGEFRIFPCPASAAVHIPWQAGSYHRIPGTSHSRPMRWPCLYNTRHSSGPGDRG